MIPSIPSWTCRSRGGVGFDSGGTCNPDDRWKWINFFLKGCISQDASLSHIFSKKSQFTLHRMFPDHLNMRGSQNERPDLTLQYRQLDWGFVLSSCGVFSSCSSCCSVSSCSLCSSCSSCPHSSRLANARYSCWLFYMFFSFPVHIVFACSLCSSCCNWFLSYLR